MPNYTLNINGNDRVISVDEDTPLLWVLRDELNLVGTKFGCGIAQCGACTVHIDGIATRSCQMQVSILDDVKITTIKVCLRMENTLFKKPGKKLMFLNVDIVKQAKL